MSIVKDYVFNTEKKELGKRLTSQIHSQQRILQ